jgi:hypothetical protein
MSRPFSARVRVGQVSRSRPASSRPLDSAQVLTLTGGARECRALGDEVLILAPGRSACTQAFTPPRVPISLPS